MAVAARILDQSRSASARCCAASSRPTRTRARIYDRDGDLLLDSRSLYRARRHPALRPAAAARRQARRRLVERGWNAPEALGSAAATCRSIEEIGAGNGRAYPEVQSARSAARRQTSCASTSAARPSSRSRCRSSASARCAARCCSRPRAATSTSIIASERLAHLPVFLVAAGVMWCCRCCSPARSPGRCAASRKRPSACGAASSRARRSPISPTAPTRSATCRARCAT